MYTVPTIPGVSLEVYKEDRRLNPESDGHVGQIFSGSATIVAVVNPGADKTFGFFRDGGDHYIKLWDWLIDPSKITVPTVQEQQRRRRALLEGRSFDQDCHVYGVKMPLQRVQGNPFNTVHYPENMLALAQYTQIGGRLTGRVHVWEAALVSQNGEFFLTVHQHYNIPACRSIRGHMCFPRLSRHRLLEKLLINNAPEGLPLTPGEDTIPVERGQVDKTLGRHEGIVTSWYAPRNMGALITSQGEARVHWTDVPSRPRLRFLKEGERVKFADLRVPPVNPGTDVRKMRKAKFQLQACGIEIR